MKKYILFITLFYCFTAFSQGDLKKADKLFQIRSYMEAAELYQKASVKNDSQEVLQKLGDCYYNNSKMDKASDAYLKLMGKYKESVDPKYYFRLAQSLKGIKQFDDADSWMKTYNVATDNNVASKSTVDFYNQPHMEIIYTLKPASINSSNSDFGTSFLQGNKVVFSSARGINGKVYKWNNQPYLDLYYATIDESGDLISAVALNEEINSKLHEATATFTNDGKTMYFSRNSTKKNRDAEKTSHLKTFKSTFSEGKWGNITELPFNNENYSVTHPALSPDNKTLYFSSDKEDSIGSFDIYSVTINDDGTYGAPTNLGASINTSERDQFPYIAKNGDLYFASNGHFGVGGLDVFVAKNTNGTFESPKNLGVVINSNKDDFAYIANADDTQGFVSSNREGGKGDDDVYFFKIEKKYYVSGIVQDKKSSELLGGSLVTLFDDKGNTVADAIVKADARYKFEINPNSTYTLKGTRKLYVPYEEDFKTDKEGNVGRNILMEMETYEEVEPAIVVQNNAPQIKINPIYFDFDKTAIRTDAAFELNKVVDLMTKYPEMVIEVGVHTDRRGSKEYNLDLSYRRSQSIKSYLTSKGVRLTNLKAIGYGEMQPRNDCEIRKNCTEADHSENRRAEFVIKQ